jgi:protein Tex
VTVTEIDLARKRIALSMRSKPMIGPKQPASGAASPRGQSQPSKPAGSFPPTRQANTPQSLNNDWFNAALNKKR